MASAHLPDRPSLDLLKKVAKERLQTLREENPDARLSAAQLDIAREYGFSSWHALKAEIDRRWAPIWDEFFDACSRGDVDRLRGILEQNPVLAARTFKGTSALHQAIHHPPAVKILLEQGADPNVRDRGDNALPLHFAAGGGILESARLLIDAGSDVHGHGDVHQLDVIGWATVFDVAHRAMLAVPNMKTPVAWYRSIGFELAARHEERGKLDWAALRFGGAETMLMPSADEWIDTTVHLSLWFRTSRLDDLYHSLLRRRRGHERDSPDGTRDHRPIVRFTQDLHTAFYGQREFGIRDPNGIELMFAEASDERNHL